MQTTIGQRIRQKRKEFKWTQQELAKRLNGVSSAAISQWESDVTKPNAKNLYDLSLLLKSDFSWLLKGDRQETNIAPVDNDGNLKIPILSQEQLHQWNVNNALPHISNHKEHLITTSKVSKFTFALQISDDSMHPEFIEGDIVLFDPLQTPNPGEFVVARINSEIVFRKFQVECYQPDGSELFSLSPLNSDFPSLSSMKNSITILGIMVEHRIYRKKR